MFVSLKANKKRVLAFVILAAVVAAACFFLRTQGQSSPEPVQVFGETNEERLAYLQSFGWQTKAQPTETREVMIPAEFNDVYQNYNAMQQAQGFDLAPYAGEVCTQYKYHITNYPGETEVYATLLVYGRLIIGGDLACAKANGFMHGFASDSARYGEATPQPQATPEQSQSTAQASIPPESQASQTASANNENYVNSSSVESAAAPDQASQAGEQPASQAESGAAEDTAAQLEDAYPTD